MSQRRLANIPTQATAALPEMTWYKGNNTSRAQDSAKQKTPATAYFSTTLRKTSTNPPLSSRADDKTAEEYALEGGATLHLVLALRGGSS